MITLMEIMWFASQNVSQFWSPVIHNPVHWSVINYYQLKQTLIIFSNTERLTTTVSIVSADMGMQTRATP